MRRTRLAAASAAAILVPLCLTAPAGADPYKGQPVEFTCANGESFTVVARGIANFNAQLVTDSNSVVHLLAYTFNVVVTDPAGTVVFEFSEEVAKSNTENFEDAVSCDYAFSFVNDAGELVSTSGPALVTITPNR